MDAPSFWHTTLGRAALAGDDLPGMADLAVIGAGVLGACAALWLARAGTRPLLLDAGPAPAAGASGRNGGLLVSGLAESYPAAVARLGRAAARDLYALTLDGVALMGRLVAEEEIDCELRAGDNLKFALDPAQAEDLADAAAMIRADGFPTELLDRAAAQELVRAPLGPEVVAARLNPAAASLHSARLVHGLAAAARRHGARLCWGVAVRALRRDGDGLLIETAHGPLRARAAIVAVNAWSGELLPPLAGLVTPVRGQALVTVPAPPLIEAGFGVSFTPTGEYGQQRPDGRMVFGGCRAVAPGRDMGIIEPEPTAPVQAALDAALPRLFPSLAGLPVEQRWAGPMAFTADYLPIAGRLPELPVWYAGGFSGHGMPFAAPLGRILAEAALGIEPPSVFALLAPERPSLAVSR